MSRCLSFIHSGLIERLLFPLKTLSNGWSVTIMVSLGPPTRYKRNLLSAKSTALVSKFNCTYFFSALLVHLDAKATGFALSVSESWANIALSPY